MSVIWWRLPGPIALISVNVPRESPMSPTARTDRPRPRAAKPRPPQPRTADQADRTTSEDRHLEDLLDEGIEESFPASDPVSVKHIT
jgi:hypothetical protein